MIKSINIVILAISIAIFFNNLIIPVKTYTNNEIVYVKIETTEVKQPEVIAVVKNNESIIKQPEVIVVVKNNESIKQNINLNNNTNEFYKINCIKEFVMDRIKIFEGLSLIKYPDSVTGDPLQGYGRNVSKRNTPDIITKDIADKWLSEDIEKCMRHLDEYVIWWRTLDNIRQVAMLDLCYNMGIQKLLTFKNFIFNMENGNYEIAANELMYNNDGKRTRYSRQVGVRAREISNAIQSGIWIKFKLT